MNTKWSIVLVSDRQSLLSPDGKTSCFQTRHQIIQRCNTSIGFAASKTLLVVGFCFQTTREIPRVKAASTQIKKPCNLPEEEILNSASRSCKSISSLQELSLKDLERVALRIKDASNPVLELVEIVEFQSCSLWQSQPGQGRSHQDFTAKSAAVY